MPRSPRFELLLPGLLAFAYGMLVYFMAEGDFEYTLFSWGFLMLVPYGAGALGVYYDWRKYHKEHELPYPLKRAISKSWLGCFALYFAALVVSFGYAACLIFGVPIMFPAAALGGITVWLFHNRPNLVGWLVVIILLSPLFVQPVEAQFETPRQLTTTHTQIHIDASAETIWNNIKTVGVISAETQPKSWLHYLGIPRPIEATLSHEGVGGIRRGYFENGLQFDEVITDWQPPQMMAFTIDKSSHDLLPKPLDMVDGEVFSIVSGIYEIEALDDGSHILHFTSTHYLQTKFNTYGSLWTDYIMKDLQNNILDVVRQRSESGGQINRLQAFLCVVRDNYTSIYHRI